MIVQSKNKYMNHMKVPKSFDSFFGIKCFLTILIESSIIFDGVKYIPLTFFESDYLIPWLASFDRSLNRILDFNGDSTSFSSFRYFFAHHEYAYTDSL